MKRTLLILIFISIVAACSSDTVVKGQVVDQNNEPIEEVMVQVMTSDIYVMTDENGKFTIDTQERGDELIFSKEGYKMQLQEIKGSKMEIELIEN